MDNECPTPQKLKFLNDAGAIAHMGRILNEPPPRKKRSQRKRDNPAWSDHRVYDCVCGYVHITTGKRGRLIYQGLKGDIL